jgi:hypothetical protein
VKVTADEATRVNGCNEEQVGTGGCWVRAQETASLSL